ncbi:histidine permease [Homalodisca vitripennis]|nr:histidine permease [Homalodisca vitripennis]
MAQAGEILAVLQALTSRVEWVSAEKEKLESELQDLLSQKEELDIRLLDFQDKLSNSQSDQKLLFAEMDVIYLDKNIENVITEAENIMRQTVNELGNPAISVLTCSPGYLRSLVPALESSINALAAAPKVGNIVPVTHLTSQFAILGKATSNTAHDIEFGDRKLSFNMPILFHPLVQIVMGRFQKNCYRYRNCDFDSVFDFDSCVSLTMN